MSISNLNAWWDDRNAQVEFFAKRKAWARRLMNSRGLKNPGDSLVAKFKGCEFSIVIGPRYGVNISPVCKKALNACSRIRSGYFELPLQGVTDK